MAGGFWHYAQEDPSYPAIVDPDGTEYSAGEVFARSNQLVHGLRALGLRHGDGIATVLPNGIVPFEVYLAAGQAGWRVTPINFHLTGPEIAYIVDDCEAKAFVVHERFADIGIAAAEELGFPKEGRLAVAGSIDGFSSYDAVKEGQPATLPPERRSGDTMHYTSGTTGRPKGVKRALPEVDPDTNAELRALFLMLFGIVPQDGNVHLLTSPNYHTAVTNFGGNSIHAGHTVVCMDKWDAEETLRLVERYRVTHTHMVPTQFHRMLALPEDVRNRYDVSSMRCAIHAAAPCPIDTKRKMLDWWGPVIYEYYGATEGGGTVATPQDWLKYPGTVGNAWPITQLKIVDDALAEVPAGTPGTIYMKMDAPGFEYKGDPEKTKASHLEGFFTVGDIGYLNEDGFLFLNDRKSDMIISGGVNIYPAEIEGEILSHPQVADAAVFGIPDDDWGEQIKAVVEPNEGVEPSPELAADILEHLKGRLGKYKWPKTIDFIDAMPRDPNGKLYKRKLRDPYWEGRDRAI
ncbi:MAG: acyl-CoA synthetase [Acidimicrobiia bacterium]